MMAVISPIQPHSVSNMQPITPLDGNSLLDKSTPAATPTGIDQHDSKSAAASPYVMPAPPSVEPPPPTLLEQLKMKSEPGARTSNIAGNGSGGVGGGGGGGGSGGGGSSSGSSSGNSSSSCSSSNNSVTPNANSAVNNGGSGASGATCAPMNPELKNILKLLKRPMLGSRENFVDEDVQPQQLLYDYSTWDAW